MSLIFGSSSKVTMNMLKELPVWEMYHHIWVSDFFPPGNGTDYGQPCVVLVKLHNIVTLFVLYMYAMLLESILCKHFN